MKQDILTQIYEWLKSISTPLIYVLIGIGANYTDHYRKGTLTWKQAIVSGVMGIVVGYISWAVCNAQGWQEHEGYIIPVATMAGERIVPYLIQAMPELIKKIVEKKTNG